ncbi:MAG: thermonuclease family protein [Alphaproteobacteria bacterium]
MAVALALWPLSAVLSQSLAEPCTTIDLGESRVAAIEDSRTLALQDGRKIRLAGIEWAVPPDQARIVLSELLDRPVTLAASERSEPDRYGRIHAFPRYPFSSVSGSETPIQYGWLERGIALVSSRGLDKTCAGALLAAENRARERHLGAFAQGGLAAHRADNYGPILSETGRFAVVEGKVLSVREAGNTLYVNFGRRWSEDFTVTIAKRLQPAFISGGVAPKSLSGQMVRVRGFIEERGGPWIEATSPAQFETAFGR